MRYVLLILLAMLLAACGSSQAIHEDIETGDTLYEIRFENPADFETGIYPDSNASLRVEDGQYILEQSVNTSTYIWGQGGSAAQNVSIEVQAATTSDYSNNLYGIMCRVDENGAGYAFLISSDGFGAIARTDGRSLSFLFDWTENDAIHTDGETNSIRAICVDDYLALYVNDTFVGDVEDDRYPDAGQVGIIGGVFVTEANTEGSITAEFDDLTVTEAALED